MARCHRYPREEVSPDWSACPSFTRSLDCADCGACCREAYHTVEVSPRDPFVRLHPERLLKEDGRRVLPRPGGRCVCLQGEAGTFRCEVYETRPKTCRDFEAGSLNCVEARRRVGLTR